MSRFIQLTATITFLSLIGLLLFSRQVDKNDFKKMNIQMNFDGDKKEDSVQNLELINFEKKFLASEVTELELDVPDQELKIVSGDSDQVRVVVKGELSPSVNLEDLMSENQNKIKVDFTALASELSDSVIVFGFVKSRKNLARKIKIEVFIPEKIARLEVNTMTGDISLKGFKTKKISLNSVSGNLTLEKIESEFFKLNTVSGDNQLQSCQFKAIEINTVSGDVEYTYSGEPKYQINFSSVSGDLTGESLVSDSNGGRFNINSVSGDVTIKKAIQ